MRTSCEVRNRQDYRTLLDHLAAQQTVRSQVLYEEALQRPAQGEDDLVWRIDYGRRFAELPIEQQRLMRLAAHGYTQADIAGFSDCSLRTIARKFSIYGIRPVAHRGPKGVTSCERGER